MIRLVEADNRLFEQNECILYDENIWENAREKIYSRHESMGKAFIPVADRNQTVLYYAYDDKEADRELRMLFELQQLPAADNFKTLYSGCDEVVIYGCNELAYYFARYLHALGINVRTQGRHWELFGYKEDDGNAGGKALKIYAEGVQSQNNKIEELFLRSSSAEFECVDEIYESNFRKGIIKNSDGTLADLLERLKESDEIIICGTDTESQDAYDLLYSYGIDILGFLSDTQEGRLLGKPIWNRRSIGDQVSYPIFIECSGRYSAEGGYGVDEYVCRGYMRNKQYILLKDYAEIPISGIRHVLRSKNIMFLGEDAICSRVKRYLKRNNIVCDEKNRAGIDGMPENTICLLCIPPEYLSGAYREHYEYYREIWKEKGLLDVSDYFSRTVVSAQLQTEDIKYGCKALKPAGIMVGCSEAYSGNMLMNNLFDNHPDIMAIPEYNFLSKQMFSICIRLAEKKASDILDYFWRIYEKEAGKEAINGDFPQKELFCQKMEELLRQKGRFSSQEIFVMLFIAYESMYGRCFSMNRTYIYWEPHNISRLISRKYKEWLFSEGVDIWVIRSVRNNCSKIGSLLKDADLSCRFVKRETAVLQALLTYPPIKSQEDGYTLEYRFEDIKLKPGEVLGDLCRKTGIPWSETFLETTRHGEIYYYHGDVTTGFDLKPVYNLFEKYLSGYDRMRIALWSAFYQKSFDYPWMDYKDFSRRELQEMFLKKFRFENFLNLENADGLSWRIKIHEKSANKLWELRCMEKMRGLPL